MLFENSQDTAVAVTQKDNKTQDREDRSKMYLYAEQAAKVCSTWLYTATVFVDY